MVEMRRRPLPAGWARDPFGRYPHRLFDGRAWSDRVARGGRTLDDVLLMGSPSPSPELTTTCDECGFDVGDAKFCPRCGTAAAPPAQAPYCYQCASNPPIGAAFCHECGSRLDALAPGLSVRDADEWRRIFGVLGWRKDTPDRERAYEASLKKPARRGSNPAALLRSLDLPAFDGEDPSEQWVLWISVGEQKRSSWLSVTSVEVMGADDEPAKVDTLILTRCRVIALSPAGLTNPPALVFTDTLANVSDATVDNEQLRIACAAAEREIVIEWRVSNRVTPLTPADLRTLTGGGSAPGSTTSGPLTRRASDRRDGGRHVAQAVLESFARQLSGISG
ncbi:MAG: zinc ribbon domain-containing protein [Actinobacteria bacterium]|nr:zinc ribbon domain-containing protein [Actinomycetota bacterium]